MLSRLEDQGQLHGICIGRGVPDISHLLYTDDLFIFCKAETNEEQVISDCLSRYAGWSGQRLNVRKSSVTFTRSSFPRTAQ